MRLVAMMLLLVSCGRGDPGEAPGAVSAQRSTVTLSPNPPIPADATYAVAVSVRDSTGRALPEHEVRLVLEGNVDIVQPGLTDETGLALGTVAAVDAGDHALVVIVDPGPDQVLLEDAPVLTFGELLLAYGFNAEGPTANDLTPGGFNGAISGATWTSDGRHGGALELDGVDDEIDIGYAQDTFFASREDRTVVTIEVWIRPREVSRVQTIYQLGGNSNSAALGLSVDGRPWFVLHKSGQSIEVMAPAPVVVDTWAHVAATQTNAGVTLYVDGAAVNFWSERFTWSTGSDGQMVGRHPIDCSGLLGACGNDGLFFFGTIDDLRVWDYGRDPDEILADMERPAP